MTSVRPYLMATRGQRFVGCIQLNSPKRLNCLTLDVIQRIYQQLVRWASADDVSMVVLHGAGDKAFCAGADVRAIRESLLASRSSDRYQHADAFFTEEYKLDQLIADYQKPIVVWGSGIVMGGGLGLLSAASHAIVTETSSLAMPEVSIGLYPDAGGSYFLNQLPRSVGRFLALTGATINAADAMQTGLAYAYCRSDSFGDFMRALYDNDVSSEAALNGVIAALAIPPEQWSDSGELATHLPQIEQCCAHQSLQRFKTEIAQIQGDSFWLKQAQVKFLSGAPLSWAIADRQLAQCEGLPLAEVLRKELVLSCNMIREGEFTEGVRALLVDKDKQPQWRYGDVSDIDGALIERLFTLSPWQHHPLDSVA